MLPTKRPTKNIMNVQLTWWGYFNCDQQAVSWMSYKGFEILNYKLKINGALWMNERKDESTCLSIRYCFLPLLKERNILSLFTYE